MHCENGICRHTKEPEPQYKWMADITTKGFICTFFKRPLLGTREDSILIDAAKSSCRFVDEYCRLAESIVVWDEHIRHQCPFRVVATAQFEHHTNSLIVNQEMNLFFQITATISECGMKIYRTAEGLYLAEADKTHK